MIGFFIVAITFISLPTGPIDTSYDWIYGVLQMVRVVVVVIVVVVVVVVV